MERPIVHDQFRLAQKSVPATINDLSVADDLKDTLVANRVTCVGMAGNMIGRNVCIIVFLEMGVPVEMFNPVIVAQKGPYQTTESCLSVAGTHETTRYHEITVEWQDRKFQKHRKKYVGLTAQIIQHEVDHCSGILI